MGTEFERDGLLPGETKEPTIASPELVFFTERDRKVAELMADCASIAFDQERYDIGKVYSITEQCTLFFQMEGDWAIMDIAPQQYLVCAMRAAVDELLSDPKIDPKRKRDFKCIAILKELTHKNNWFPNAPNYRAPIVCAARIKGGPAPRPFSLTRISLQRLDQK